MDDLQVERTLKFSEVDDSSEELKSGLGSYAFKAWALLLAFRLNLEVRGVIRREKYLMLTKTVTRESRASQYRDPS